MKTSYFGGGGGGGGSLTPPVNPTDNGKTARALGGDLSYIGGATAGQMWNWSGSQWQPGVDFGALTPVTTAGFAANSGSGFIRVGLVAGSGAGVASAAASGSIRGARGALGFTIKVRNNGDSADSTVLSTDTANPGGPVLTIGETGVGGLSPTICSPIAGLILLNAGNTGFAQLTSTSWAWAVPLVAFSADQVNPFIVQSDNILNNQVGQKLSIRAQRCPGTTSIGGALDIGPGNGTTRSGLGRLITTEPAAQRFAWNDTGIGFYATAPIALQTVTGSRASGAALVDLLTKLANLGLIIDGTTA